MEDTDPVIPGTVLHPRAIGRGIPGIVRRLLAIALRLTAIVQDIRGTVGLRQPLCPHPALGIRTDLVRIRRGHGRAEVILRRSR
jgi:hypothetical protein